MFKIHHALQNKSADTVLGHCLLYFACPDAGHVFYEVNLLPAKFDLISPD